VISVGSSSSFSSLARASASQHSVGARSSLTAVSRILPALSSALLVAISYYIGTQIGFAWTPSGRPISVFWPPNAVLLAALLLVPLGKWWTFLIVIFPAHMFAQLHAGVPTWTAIGWFLTNCSEALIGAFCITRLINPKDKLDSVRGVCSRS
jgi:integral membrane sensor domain MASE1